MKLFLPLLTFLFSTLYLQAQNIDSTIEKYATTFSQERAYLHFDKSNYAAGETVWYKVYLMSGILPTEDSKTFYLDWTDDKGKLLSHSLIPMVYSTAAGQFDIPSSYTGKFIHVKAYTKWMLNFDSAFLYNKDIRILSKSLSPIQKNNAIASLQFFPEGGDAIEGVSNKIAFKANDQWGKPVKIKGLILDSHGTKIDSLHVIHDGMGYFFIFPKSGESFTAKWKDEKGAEHTTSLPVAKENGVSLQVAINGNKREFVIMAPAGSASTLGPVHIIGTMNQHEIFKLTKPISDGVFRGSIPTVELPSGILTITVFDNKWMPLAERITYINNQEYLFTPETTVEHWGLNKRAKNEISITVPDSLDASFSVAVTDLNIDSDSSDNIISHLLLTEDLRGQVYNPSYYFANNSDSMLKQLDLVMLTHGWRRFKWDDVVAGKFPKISYPKDTSYLTLSGKLFGALPSQLRNAGNIVVIINEANQKNKMLAVPIQPNGTFNDPTVVLFDTTHLYYQLPKSSGLGDASVQFMGNRMPPLPFNIPASPNFYNQSLDTTGDYRHFMLASEEAKLLSLYTGKVLETVTIKGVSKTPVQLLDEKYASGLFSGGDAYQFDLLHDPFALTSLSIFNYLQGKVAGLQINSSSNPPTLQWRGGSPQIFLDEMPVDANMVSSLSVSDIAYVKVLRPPFMGGTNGANGAIAIYTRRGNDRQTEPGNGLSNNTVTGYNSMREFYSPNYSNFDTNNDKRDVRSTLYWNPMVFTTRQNNKVLLTFYNNDISGAFRVVIEGMTRDGRLAHLETTME